MRTALVVGLLTSLLVGCGGSSTDARAPLVGVYQLISVNGSSLPAVISVSGGVTTYLNSEVLTVSSNGTYQTNGAESQQNSAGYGSSFAVSSTGTYKASGTGYTYTFTDKALGSGSGTLSAGTFSGSILTVSLGGVTYGFTKP